MSVVYDDNDNEIPLCLSCYAIFSRTKQAEIETLERQANYYSAQIVRSVGLPASFATQFPPRYKPLYVEKMNNISVSNSVVGTINTGSINSINQTISALIQLGEVSVAEAVKGLTDAIINSKNLEPNQKNELIETIDFVSTEAVSPIENRKSIIGLNLLENGLKVIKLADDLVEVYQKYWPILESVFT